MIYVIVSTAAELTFTTHENPVATETVFNISPKNHPKNRFRLKIQSLKPHGEVP